MRELEEETGILNEQIMYTTGPLKTFRWNREGIEYEEHVYAVQVSPETQVLLSTEHDEYRWLIPERAKELFKFSEVQDGVDILQRKAATQHQVVAKVTRALASELGWTLNPASLRSIFAGFANHVFSFEYENEYRFLIYTIDKLERQPTYFEIPIEIPKLKLSVVTHPNMEEWKYENIKRLIDITNTEVELIKSATVLRQQ